MRGERIDHARVHQRQLHNILCAAVRDAEIALEDLSRAIVFVRTVRDDLAAKVESAPICGETLDVEKKG